MREFLHLNLSKLKRFLVVFSLIFTIFLSGILLYTLIIDQVPDISLIAVIYLFTSLIAPLMIIMVVVLKGVLDLKKKRKVFSKLPFNNLMRIGFVEKFKYLNHKWKIVEPVLVGKINTFTFVAEIDTQFAPKVIKFQAIAIIKKIDKEGLMLFNLELKSENFFFDYNGYSREFKISKSVDLTTKDLENELIGLTKILIRRKIEPNNSFDLDSL